jgi:pimeloyl-ACP methyl ester carboxylesterase
MPATAVQEPPAIPGVRRCFVNARGVRVHVTEAGDPDGRPVVALHGWPQHHYAYRDLLADPPAGLRIIVPDLPGYGWSGPPPHKWAKEDVAADMVALLDALGLDKVLLVGHDWGAFVGYLMLLRAPERFDGYLALNMAHVWLTPRSMAKNLPRSALYMPFVAAFGVPLQQSTPYLERVIYSVGAKIDRDTVRIFADRFRDPVCARAATDTYRTFLLREVPHLLRHPESRRATVPIRALFGVRDAGVHPDLASPETANADDYTLQTTDCGHFVADEQPALVREALLSLAKETA